MTPESVLSSLKRKLGSKVRDARTEKTVYALKKGSVGRVWFSTGRQYLREAVKHLISVQKDPHFAVCSGYDTGKDIEVIYHFTVNYGSPLSEITVSMKVGVGKKDPVIPTITDLIPGALVSEREMQEMLGVRIEGIPDSRRLFLNGSYPEGVYPWRRDETGPEKLVRNLNEEEGK